MWTTSLSDLRTLLHDGPQDKRAYEKRVVGNNDGKNGLFRILEPRYIPTTLRVYVNQVLQVLGSSNDYLESDPVSGEFTFNAGKVPPRDTPVRASYYFQYFLDAELTSFIQNGLYKLGLTDVNSIDPGLIPACLHYAGADAFEKLAVRWGERLSDQFLSEDSLGSDGHSTTPKTSVFLQMAQSMMKTAVTLRDDFYKKQGRQLDPAYSVLVGNEREFQPRR